MDIPARVKHVFASSLPRWQDLSWLALSCIAYFAAYRLAFFLPATAGVIAAIWPASGIALASVLLAPRRLWPALFVIFFAAGLLVNVTAGKLLTHSLGFGMANVGETCLSALLISRLSGTRVTFTRVVEVVSLILAATLVNATTALVGATVASMSSAAPVEAIFRTWWISNALGILLLTPLIVAWSAGAWTLRDMLTERAMEAGVLLILWCITAWSLFAMSGTAPITPYAYVIFALLAWVALRLGTGGTAAFLVVLALIAIGHAASSPERVLLAQLFVGIAGVTGLLLAASVTERRLSEESLRVLSDNLPNGMVYQILLDTDGNRRFIHVSAGVERLHGISAAEVLRDPDALYRQIIEEDRALIATAEEKSIREMSLFSVVVRVRRPDGAVRWMHVSSMPRSIPGGSRVWDGIEIDITERMEAEAGLRAAVSRTRAFLRYSPIVYWRCDAAGCIEIASWRCQALLAGRQLKMHSTNIDAAFPPECVRWFRRHVQEVQRTGAPATHELETPTCEGRRHFLATVFPVIGEADSSGAFGVMAIDVTDLKVIEHERERLNAILTRVTEALPVCLSYVDGDGRYAWTNTRNGERLGHPTEWIIGRTVPEVYGERYGQIERDFELLRTGQTVHREVPWTSADGAQRIYDRYMVSAGGSDATAGGRGVTSLWLDITESKLAAQREHENAERMRTLSRRLIEAQELERRAVARELHDEVGQLLTAVNTMLQSIRKKIPDAELGNRLDEGIALVNRSIDDIRNVSLRLRPAILDDLGLVPALRWLVATQGSAAHMNISLEIESLPTDVPPDIATGCFRIVQEAITNAIRYARADTVTVRLRETDARIELEIQDNGVGFSHEQVRARAAEGRGSGLSGMRERAELLGGACEISSEAGCGSRVEASLPLPAG